MKRAARQDESSSLWSQTLLLALCAAAGMLALSGAATVLLALPALLPVTASAAAFCCGFAVAGIWIVGHHRRLLALWADEERLAADIDGDGFIGRPGPREVQHGDHHVIVRAWNPVSSAARMEQSVDLVAKVKDRRDFRAFVEGVWGLTGSALRSWEGQDLPSGRQMTRMLWEEYTERLIQVGIARRHDLRPNAPLVKRATLEQALEILKGEL